MFQIVTGSCSDYILNNLYDDGTMAGSKNISETPELVFYSEDGEIVNALAVLWSCSALLWLFIETWRQQGDVCIANAIGAGIGIGIDIGIRVLVLVLVLVLV